MIDPIHTTLLISGDRDRQIVMASDPADYLFRVEEAEQELDMEMTHAFDVGDEITVKRAGIADPYHDDHTSLGDVFSSELEGGS